jgi:hypothetical protein
MSTCTRCGAPFSCGMADGAGESCWCMRLPPVVPVPGAQPSAAPAGCWCPACLEQHIAQSDPAPSATTPAGAQRRV